MIVKQLTPALIAAALTATIALADDSRLADENLRFHMLQIKLPPVDEARLAAFRERAATIISCKQAREVGAELGGEVVERHGVKAEQLPPSVSASMDTLKVGHATHLYGNPDEGMKVLVLCSRTRSIPMEG